MNREPVQAGDESGQARDIFDRRRRRAFRDRAFARAGGRDLLAKRWCDDLIERIDFVQRDFARGLVVGQQGAALVDRLRERGLEVVLAEAGHVAARALNGVLVEEDRLPFADGSFDLLVNVGTLDSVNDLPGALTLTRRILRPDGLFLGVFAGAGTLATAKRLLLQAEAGEGSSGAVRPHIHPQIDVRTAGDLLTRAGFAMPVADGDSLTLRYRELAQLVADIRDGGGGNALLGAGPTLGREVTARLFAGFDAARDGTGRVSETVESVYLVGWSPHPEQPKPARRGSGRQSLAQTLGKG